MFDEPAPRTNGHAVTQANGEPSSQDPPNGSGASVNGQSSIGPEQSSSRVGERPRARLGPTEVVFLPNSDSEDEEDDEDGDLDGEAGERTDGADLLRGYGEDTEVTNSSMELASRSSSESRIYRYNTFGSKLPPLVPCGSRDSNHSRGYVYGRTRSLLPSHQRYLKV